jgi:hypothetical protein
MEAATSDRKVKLYSAWRQAVDIADKLAGLKKACDENPASLDLPAGGTPAFDDVLSDIARAQDGVMASLNQMHFLKLVPSQQQDKPPARPR